MTDAERPGALDRYRSMRRFDRTPEPSGEGRRSTGDAGPPRFVVQEHHARALHWDVRLEHDGVLASWAVPKGIPLHPRENHLAIRTEDHPLEYLDFAGEVPERLYGAGRVSTWDRGTFELLKWRDDEVMVTLRGQRVTGRYVLFRTGGRDWMIHRMDPPADPGREPMPTAIAPMLARLVTALPDGPDWAYEVKWDGIRALAFIDGGRLRLITRNGIDVAGRYPEIRGLAQWLGSLQAVLDGEIVALDDLGRPSFERLQRRMGRPTPRTTASVPVHYVIFDLLFLDGHGTMELPYRERRRLLESLDLAGAAWRTPPVLDGDAALVSAATRAQGLEGVIAKQVDSRYEPGRRTGAWVKVKHHRRQHFVVGGWVPREGSGGSAVGALLLGYWTADPPRLAYAGRVGTGFTEPVAASLADLLGTIARPASPFVAGAPAAPGARFVEPSLVVDVEFLEWTGEGFLRQPSFKGLRDDLDPAAVRRE